MSTVPAGSYTSRPPELTVPATSASLARRSKSACVDSNAAGVAQPGGLVGLDGERHLGIDAGIGAGVAVDLQLQDSDVARQLLQLGIDRGDLGVGILRRLAQLVGKGVGNALQPPRAVARPPMPRLDPLMAAVSTPSTVVTVMVTKLSPSAASAETLLMSPGSRLERLGDLGPNSLRLRGRPPTLALLERQRIGRRQHGALLRGLHEQEPRVGLALDRRPRAEAVTEGRGESQ